MHTLKSVNELAGGKEPDGAWTIVFGEQYALLAKLLATQTRSKLCISLRSNKVDALAQVARHTAAGAVRSMLRKLNIFRAALSERVAVGLSDIFIVQSEFDRAHIAARVSSKRAQQIRVVPNNISGSWMRREYRNTNRSAEVRKLLVVGSVGVRKGFPVLFEAFRQMVHEGMDVELTVIGSGRLGARYQRIANADERMTERVRFLGQIPDALSSIAEADLLIVPSLYDSYPNVILEALWVGTPVIASSSGGAPEILGSAADTALFPPGSPEAIVRRVTELRGDPSAYQELKKRQQERVPELDFDWPERFAKALQIPGGGVNG
jgi:glycosyltransferase involved in cell wall biosynthesis